MGRVKTHRAAVDEREPLRWKSLIDEYPTENDFKEAWKAIFEFYPKDCVLVGVSCGINAGFSVCTPTTMHRNGGFSEHTETPILTDKSIWYSGGANWGVDNAGQRFYYVDRETLLPTDWENVKATEIIRRFIRNKVHDVAPLFKQLEA